MYNIPRNFNGIPMESPKRNRHNFSCPISMFKRDMNKSQRESNLQFALKIKPWSLKLRGDLGSNELRASPALGMDSWARRNGYYCKECLLLSL
jgi:hypothetical protein